MTADDVAARGNEYRSTANRAYSPDRTRLLHRLGPALSARQWKAKRQSPLPNAIQDPSWRAVSLRAVCIPWSEFLKSLSRNPRIRDVCIRTEPFSAPARDATSRTPVVARNSALRLRPEKNGRGGGKRALFVLGFFSNIRPKRIWKKTGFRLQCRAAH